MAVKIQNAISNFPEFLSQWSSQGITLFGFLEIFLIFFSPLPSGCREQPPRGAPWVSGLVGHFVQTWLDNECSHTVQFSDCRAITLFLVDSVISSSSSGLTCFGTVWPFWCWCAVKLWYNQFTITVYGRCAELDYVLLFNSKRRHTLVWAVQPHH